MKPASPGLLLCCLVLAGCAGGGARAPQANLEQAAVYNTQLAVDALRKNNLQEARDKITRALDQDPRNAEVQSAAGLIYERLGEDRLADTHYGRALALAPDNPAIQNNYAVYLCRKGSPERGQRLFLEAARNPLYRTPEVAFVNAGMCARTAGNVAQAEQHFRSALNLNARNGEALLQMAELEFEAGNQLPARAFLERHLAAAPARPQALWLGVRLERATGNEAVAAGYAERLKNQFPTSVETRALLDSERAAR